VTSGTLQSVGLLARVLSARGIDRIAMEQPGFHIHRALLRRCGLTVVPVPVDGDGIVVERLERSGARAVLVTPAHQMPLGAVLAPDRRAALLDWAERHDALVIEDDYDGEYRYDHQPVGALQGLDPDRVIYAGTVSKTLAPALRLGWLVLPQRLLEPTLQAKELLAAEPSAIEQLTMAELMQSGAYDRHVRRTRLRYRRRRDLLLSMLAEHAPALTLRGIAAGLHVAVDLPPDVAEHDVVARAAAAGLRLNSLAPFWHDPTDRPGGLTIGYAAPPDHAYAQTLVVLAAALTQASDQTRFGRAVSTR
jgi:GntR family transcriptional regulator/MocR family aminotransferase